MNVVEKIRLNKIDKVIKSKHFGNILALLKKDKYKAQAIMRLQDYFNNDNMFAIDFIKNLSIFNDYKNIFDFSNIVMLDKEIFSKVKIDELLNVNAVKTNSKIIVEYIKLNNDIDIDVILKYANNDYEILKLIIDKNSNYMSKLNTINVDLYKYAVSKGYVLTLDDINKMNELLYDDVFIYCLDKNSKLTTLINNNEILIKVLNSGYEFTHDDLKNNPFLQNSVVIGKCLKKDLKCIEFANYDIDLYEEALNQIISLTKHSYDNYFFVIEKYKNGISLNESEKKLLESIKKEYDKEPQFDYETVKKRIDFFYKDNIHFLNDAINSLLDRSESDNFIIDKKYLMNSINKFIKANDNIDIITESKSIEFLSIVKFVKFNKLFPKNFGEEIETLYKRDDIIFGMHGSRENGPRNASELENDLNGYFENGIENKANNRVDWTVALKSQGYELQDFLGYSYGPSDSLKFIVAIPTNGLMASDNPIPIWHKYSTIHYLLPQYIYGCILNSGTRNARLIKNENYMKDIHFDNLVFDKSIQDLEIRKR